VINLIELMRESDLVSARVLLLAGRDAVDHKTLRALRKPLVQLSRIMESPDGEVAMPELYECDPSSRLDN
jgi:hypothetical protein